MVYVGVMIVMHFLFTAAMSLASYISNNIIIIMETPKNKK